MSRDLLQTELEILYCSCLPPPTKILMRPLWHLTSDITVTLSFDLWLPNQISYSLSLIVCLCQMWKDSLKALRGYCFYKAKICFVSSQLCEDTTCPLTSKFLSFQPWIKLNIITKFKETPSRLSGDVTFTNTGRTDGQPENMIWYKPPTCLLSNNTHSYEALKFTHVQTDGRDQTNFDLLHFLRCSSRLLTGLSTLCGLDARTPVHPFPRPDSSCTMSSCGLGESCDWCSSASRSSSHQAPASLTTSWCLWVLEKLDGKFRRKDNVIYWTSSKTKHE